MGRVHPPKVQPGESVTHGSINEGVDEIRSQASNIDALNLRDEALGQEQFVNNAFVRDFSYWRGNGPSRLLERYAGDGGTGSTTTFPSWTSANVVSKNDTSSIALQPHVTISNNPNNKDSSIIRVSCGIFMTDYGAQTYRRSYKTRYKPAIIKCAIGSAETASSSASDYEVHPTTIQWFQMPWSGARWNSFAIPDDSDPGLAAMHYNPLNPTTGEPTSRRDDQFVGWYGKTSGQRQIVPHQNYDAFGFSKSDEVSPMVFHYNFHYQTTLVWEPDTVGNQTRHFVLLAKATFDNTSNTGIIDGIVEEDSCSRSTTYTVTDEDGDESESTDTYASSYKFVRHSVDFPGFYIRNLTMSGLTYTGGR